MYHNIQKHVKEVEEYVSIFSLLKRRLADYFLKVSRYTM
jgi:hypothetical protein